MGMLASGLLAFLVVRVLGLADAPGGGGSGAGGGGAGGGGAGGGAGGGGAVVITPRFYLARMAPVGFFMALTLWAGNAVYLRLTVSFIQVTEEGGEGVRVGGVGCKGAGGVRMVLRRSSWGA